MRHLTLTGYYAGQTLCNGERTGNDLHAMFAPLDNLPVRRSICRACMLEYLASFGDDETLPEWASEFLNIVKTEHVSE